MISSRAGRECLRTDLTRWEIGPYHGALPGPMRLELQLDGEVIVSARTELGYLHRGVEKAFERHSWRAAIPYADRVDPENAVFAELALCLAVEEIAQLIPPLRAQRVRVILCELTRISSHLAYFARLARAVGADTMTHYALREREKILDLFELLSGARFSLSFLRFGGICADVTEGFIERVLEACDMIRQRMKEYNDLFSFNRAFLSRSALIGVISERQARELGITGPNARSAGIRADARKTHPYSGYDQIDFQVPVGQGEVGTLGDAHDRSILRLREIAQSVEILRQAAEKMAPGPYLAPEAAGELRIKPGEAYARIESSRGLLGCHVVSDGGDKPYRIQFRVPSLAHVAAVPALLEGSRVEDLPVIMASLDIGVAEADR